MPRQVLGEQIQLRESDMVTFHNYTWPEYFKQQVTSRSTTVR